jgi:hypothetical protein
MPTTRNIGQVEGITSVQRGRCWSVEGEGKARLARALLAPVLITARRLLLLVPLVVTACVSPPPDEYRTPAAALPVKHDWKGVFSCSRHFERTLPAITWKRIPFHQEDNRLTGLYTFTDAFNYRDSVMFSGTVNKSDARMTVTAVRADGATNFTADLMGSRQWMTGQMMTGASLRPVRFCTLALAPF